MSEKRPLRPTSLVYNKKQVMNTIKITRRHCNVTTKTREKSLFTASIHVYYIKISNEW